MSDCPLADECPSFTERIEGMGCTHYGDRGGAEWCNHYNQPIEDLKSQPVKPGEEVVVEIEDIHESGAGVGRTEDGFIIMVDGILPPARARVEVTQVMSNHARAKELERLPDEPEEGEEGEGEAEAEAAAETGEATADGAEGESDVEATEAEGEDVTEEDEEEDEEEEEDQQPRLGSRDNFWGS